MTKAKTMIIKWDICCRIFGHKWDKSRKYDQLCKKCSKWRVLMYNKYHTIGENPYSWKIM